MGALRTNDNCVAQRQRGSSGVGGERLGGFREDAAPPQSRRMKDVSRKTRGGKGRALRERGRARAEAQVQVCFILASFHAPRHHTRSARMALNSRSQIIVGDGLQLF